MRHARRMLDANPRLLPLGAERLIAVDRFLLGPNEAWPVTPPGHFSYLVARAEQPLTEPPARVSPELLLAAARSLSALLEAARREGILLNLAPEEMSLSGEGRIHLRHPGLNPQDGPSMDEAAMAFLQSLPLEAEARASISGATSVEDVIARFSPPSAPPENATVLVDRSRLQQESETCSGGQTRHSRRRYCVPRRSGDTSEGGAGAGIHRRRAAFDEGGDAVWPREL